MIIKTDRDLIQNYLTDASNFKSENCEGIFIPENVEEITELVKKANVDKIPLTISGAGTGLVGGRVPTEGWILFLEKFNKINNFDYNNRHLTVESFVTLSEIQNLLENSNLFYPPDPTEKNCSIGGTIATNASGARTLKYGPTRNWINAIKVVLPDGDVLNIRRGNIFADGLTFNFRTESGEKYYFRLPEFKMPNVKNAAGYFIKPNMDLIDLFIGSEGTLGIVIEAKLKLIEKPVDLLSMVIFFETFNDAYEFVCLARSIEKSEEIAKIKPRALEFFDDRALNFLSSKFIEAKGKNFAIWFEQEIYDEDKDELIDELSNLILRCNGNLDQIWFAFNEKEIDQIKEFRHAISALVNEYISRNNLRKVGTDIAVPSSQFKNFYNFCCKECSNNSINYVGYGHIGNDHLHLNMLPVDKIQNEIALKLYREFCVKAIELGGTISAEHGIGKLKRNYFELMYPEKVIYEMFNIKKTFDPNLILNRGNIFPDKFYYGN